MGVVERGVSAITRPLDNSKERDFMSKFTARRLFNKFRKEGVPFLLAAKTSKLLSKSSETSKLMGLSEFSPALRMSCECCGMPQIIFKTSKGEFILDVWRQSFF